MTSLAECPALGACNNPIGVIIKELNTTIKMTTAVLNPFHSPDGLQPL
jgi:hypothetical protein